ncbi:MAG TPA: elongation factor P [Dehalococcoidia bacterium]|nr:elongation factor P [Dehalococcoidia bacterium]
MIDAGELKKGMTIELDGQLFQVLDYQHIKIGRGSAQLRLKLRNIKAGHTTERSFQASEKFIKAYLERRPVQFLYNDGDIYHFMDTETYDQIAIDKHKISDSLGYLKDGLNIEMIFHNGVTMGVELPLSVELKVIETGPGFKGNTASAGSKPAIMETGITIQVPFFVNMGDIIKVDTRNGTYLERKG